MFSAKTLRAAHRFALRSFARAAAAIALAASAALWGCSGLEESAGIPAKVVSSSTAGVMRVSLEGANMDAMRQSAEMIYSLASKSKSPQTIQMAGILGLSMANLDPGVTPELDAYEASRKTLAEAGVREVYVLLGAGSDSTRDFLLRGESGKAEQMQASFAEIAAQVNASIDGGAEVRLAAPGTLTEIARGWYSSSPEGSLPETGDAARAAELNASLDALDNSAFAFVFSMPDDFEQQVAHMMEDPQELGPAAMFAGQFEESITNLRAIAASVRFGDSPLLQVQGDFADEASASDFSAQWNSLLVIATGMMAMGAQPDQAAQMAAQAEAMRTALSMDAQGAVVKIAIDRAKLETLLK
ncbi:MAG: hypothetical protein O2819_05390 [Planctomycetota bacterium]|nr:hypothetical protein [Planctomycetota bacterium]MDA1106379.1 hypothetical protein [Planctomycetota bacterium]